MPTYHYANFAVSVVYGGAGGAGTAIGATDTSFLLQPGDGATFPTSFPFTLTFGGDTRTPEIVLVNSMSGDQITNMTRAQEGTVARPWALGTLVQQTLTADGLAGKADLTGADFSGDIHTTQLQVGPVNTTAAPVVLLIGDEDTNTSKGWAIYEGQDGSLNFYEWNAGHIALTLSPTGGIQGIGGQTTAGSYGAAIVLATTKQQSVANTTNTTITSATVPSGSTRLLRVCMQFWFGSGNTNNGTVTTQVVATDPILGSVTLNFTNYVGATAIAAATITKGTATRCSDLMLEVTSGSTVTLKYQNSAAGTISDRVTASIELLA